MAQPNAVAAVTLGNPVAVVSLGAIGVSLVDSTGKIVAGQNVTDDGTSTSQTVTFSNVAAGTYTVTAVRFLADNVTPVAPAVSSDPFTVQQVTINVTVPTSVAVTVA
jgi:hypothetical protein